MTEEWSDPDRQNALLTKGQREKLLDGELDRGDRQNIRERLNSTMLDFALLNEELRERDKLQMVYPDAVDWKNKNDERVLNQLATKLASGKTFNNEVAVGIVNLIRFAEETALYPDDITGLGEMGHAAPQADWAKAFAEIAERAEQAESGDKIEVSDMTGDMIEMASDTVHEILSDEIEGEPNWDKPSEVFNFSADGEPESNEGT